jgi:ABC-type nitrate/sulfonate/bicarbonate transport system substrate-binding protein
VCFVRQLQAPLRSWRRRSCAPTRVLRSASDSGRSPPIEKGYFQESGIDVEPLKFARAQQVMEAMLSGRSDGSANGTGSANLAIGEIAQPGLFKIFCTNPSNAKWGLDEFIVAKDNPAKTIADLKGKKLASRPGIQNVTLCKTMLERAGATATSVIELPIGQHVAAVAAGQVEVSPHPPGVPSMKDIRDGQGIRVNCVVRDRRPSPHT